MLHKRLSGLLQQSHFAVKRDINPVETIAIRAIEPEYKFIIAVEPLTEQELEVLQLIVDGYSNIAIARELYICWHSRPMSVRSFAETLC